MKAVMTILAVTLLALTTACSTPTKPAEKFPFCVGCYDGGS